MNSKFLTQPFLASVIIIIGMIPLQTFAQEQAAQVPAEEKPATKKLKTLNDHFPFQVPETAEAWQLRKSELRSRVLVATGLWPMPEKSPLRPVIHRRIERDGFTMEKVYFESLPGHFVTGMLFRPAADNQLGVVDGKRPAVLSPHGHGGRTMRLSDGAIENALKSGAEKFAESGRYPKLARCAHLARMGCVTLIFDMLGYADSQQISNSVAHRHAKSRAEELNRNQPCFFSIDADLNLQSIMGLQTWNAIRALDFLESLPEVDSSRLGVTGGSGGGTQTILLGAIDSRVRASFPNGMVSTSMQGGCFCENCNYLRVGTGNVELAAVYAPNPQGMTAANDWTKDMLTDGFPQLQKLYTMLGKPDNVMCGDVLRFSHNYNNVTREMMYPWMARHLSLPPQTPLEESNFEPFSEAEMMVWDDQHPAPKKTGVPHERQVLRWWKSQSDREIQSTVPDKADNAKQWQRYRDVVGTGWNVIFDRKLPKKSDLLITKTRDATQADPSEQYLVRHPKWNVNVPVLVRPSSTGKVKRHVVYASPLKWNDGRDKHFHSLAPAFGDEDATQIIPELLDSDPSDSPGEQPLIDDPRSYSAFTFGYNRTLTVKRFEQILCVLAAFAPTEPEQSLVLMGDGEGIVASAAGAAMVAGPVVDQLLVMLEDFRFVKATSYADKRFVPGAVKYLDMPGLLSLRAPYPLGILDETDESMELVRRVYKAADASDQLQLPFQLLGDEK